MFNKLLLASLLATPSVVSGSESNVYGYIDMVASKTDSDNNHNGVDNTLSLYPNSSIMFGANYKISDIVTAHAQIVANGDTEGEPKGFVDIASLAFTTPYDSNIALGKQRLPISMQSRNAYRGINTPWITLPESVYDYQTPNSFTGASANHAFQWKEINIDSSIFVGSANKQVKQTHIIPELFTESKYTNIVGGSVLLSHKPFKYFASYMQAEHRSEISENVQARLSLAPHLINEASLQVGLDKSDVEFKGIGVSYDVGSNVTVSGEILDKQFDSGLINSTFGYYASVTYKFNVMTLTATFAEEQLRDWDDELSDLQSQLILTSSYKLSPKLKVAAEYTHTNSKVRLNPNFERHLNDDGTNQLSVAVQYRF